MIKTITKIVFIVYCITIIGCKSTNNGETKKNIILFETANLSHKSQHDENGFIRASQQTNVFYDGNGYMMTATYLGDHVFIERTRNKYYMKEYKPNSFPNFNGKTYFISSYGENLLFVEKLRIIPFNYQMVLQNFYTYEEKKNEFKHWQ